MYLVIDKLGTPKQHAVCRFEDYRVAVRFAERWGYEVRAEAEVLDKSIPATDDNRWPLRALRY